MTLHAVQKPFRTWVPGDRIEPQMYMSRAEMAKLVRDGTLVPWAEVEAKRKAKPTLKRIKIVDPTPVDANPTEGPQKENLPKSPPEAPRRSRKESKE